MSGESTIAKQLVQEALTTAGTENSISSETLLFALLRETLSELLQTRSRTDVENYITYQLDNFDESEWVITRGC